MKKICHITSAHPPEDGRIFRRACISAARAGYDTYLIERGETYEKQGVHIIGIGEPKKTSRLFRMVCFAKKAYKTALTTNADLYHLHDPELLPYALKLKKKGKKVVFDSHENYVEQIKNKTYLPKVVARILAKIYDLYSRMIFSRIDGLTYPGNGEAVTYFDKLCNKVVPIDNLPWLSELFDKFNETQIKEKNTVCYIGGLEEHRGITQIIKAARLAHCKLYLAGPFYSEEYKKKLEQMEEYSCVSYLGVLNRDKIAELLNKVEVGLCMLLDVGQYYKMLNLPTKVYEYMSMGLPCIINNSPYNVSFLKQYNIGYAVDSNNELEIAKAIRTLLDDSALRRQCKDNGRNAVLSKYCWDKEQIKLLGLYDELLN